MGATIRLTRSSQIGPRCLRPLQVHIDGKQVQPIKAGATNSYSVTPGSHRIRVKQDISASDELSVPVGEDADVRLECGSHGDGWLFFLILIWAWRVFVPGKLFFIRRFTGTI